MSVDAIAAKMVENGMALIAFLVIVYVFGARLIGQLGQRGLDILDKRLGEMVAKIEMLVQREQAMSEKLEAAVSHHEERSRERHEAFLHSLAEHHKVALDLAEQIRRTELRREGS